jgi:hypothetical protein
MPVMGDTIPPHESAPMPSAPPKSAPNDHMFRHLLEKGKDTECVECATLVMHQFLNHIKRQLLARGHHRHGFDEFITNS